MTTTTFPRINDIVARQRSSRLRDLAFSLVLALGIGLSAGAFQAAVAHASAAPAATLTAPAADTAAVGFVCDVDLAC